MQSLFVQRLQKIARQSLAKVRGLLILANQMLKHLALLCLKICKRIYCKSLYLFRRKIPGFFKPGQLGFTYSLLPVAIEFLTPVRFLFLQSELPEAAAAGRQQNFSIAWKASALWLWLLRKQLEKATDCAVSRAYSKALNRNRVPAKAHYSGPPACGLLKRLVIETAILGDSEIMADLLPGPFLAAASDAFILSFKDETMIYREILLPARLLLGRQILEGYFQLQGLCIPALSLKDGSRASYRLRRNGIRLALALEDHLPCAITFSPDRDLDRYDKLPAVLPGASLFFRLTHDGQLQIYEQEFTFVLNHISIAEAIDETGYYESLKNDLGTTWQEIQTHILPGVKLERRLFASVPLARAQVHFPLPAQKPSLTRA